LRYIILMIKTLYWKNSKLYVLDQRLLPGKVRYIACSNHSQVAGTIKDMAIRGAPAIGVCAAYGIALAAGEKKFGSLDSMKKHLYGAAKALAGTRPTAVNLFWALERMKNLIDCYDADISSFAKFLLKAADGIYNEDIDINKKIGSNGAKLFRKKSGILTHCNAGALATAGYGTALGVIRSVHSKGLVRKIFVDETRPYLQGSRLTAFEMKTDKIPYVLITDNMAGYFMQCGEIDAVIVGADRIARNGDTANKIGTYSLSVLAKYHKIPFYVAAPVSTIDLATPNGRMIKIEERSTKEVVNIGDYCIAPEGTTARHPAFDVTPARNITAIITEKGVSKPGEISRIKV